MVDATDDKEIEGEIIGDSQNDASVIEEESEDNQSDYESISSVFDTSAPMAGLEENFGGTFGDGSALLETPHGLESIISGNTIYHERLPMMEIVFDRLVRLLTGTLRNFTGDNVEVVLDNIISVRFGDYLNSVPHPAMVNVFNVEEWDNQGLVVIDTDLIYSMIDVLLGGRSGVVPMRMDARYFTSIEHNLIEKLVHLFLNDLSAAFDPLCAITVRFDRTEMNPKFATITRATNVAILVRISVQMMDVRGGSIELLIPYATMEPIRELLLQKFMGEKFGRDSIWENHLVKQLIQTDFEISAILDEVSLDLKKVLEWEVGSQILLEVGPDSTIQLVCESHPLFRGKVGRKSGNVAVKIESIIHTDEKVEGA